MPPEHRAPLLHLTPALDQDLPPLSLPPLHVRGEPVQTSVLPWRARWIDAMGRLLPLVAMGALALVTTWLLRQTQRSEPVEREMPVRHVPDYEMRGFSIQRHVEAGLAPSVIEGDIVRHFPDTDTLEIDGVRVRWLEPTGQVTVIRAARAVLYEERSEVVLEGEARLVRPASRVGEPALELAGDRLVVDTERQIVHSDKPVVLRQGDDVFEGAAMRYEHRAGELVLSGAVHGRVKP